jgi:hypothetical protein
MSPRSTSWLCSLRRMTCSNRQVCHWPLAKAAKQQNDPAQTQGGCSHGSLASHRRVRAGRIVRCDGILSAVCGTLQGIIRGWLHDLGSSLACQSVQMCRRREPGPLLHA